jgi:hypothetical protein
MVIKKPYLLIFWFLPIFVSMSTFRLKEFGLTDYISYMQLLLILLGLFYLLMQSTTVRFSLRVLFILLTLAFNMLYSDVSEYQLVVFLVGYAFMTHMIAKKNPHEIWSQYTFVCLVVVWLTIIDFFSFFILGDFIISSRTPEVIGIGLPRINTIFDEMSHQAFFLMPAAMFSLIYNTKNRYLLLLSVLLTMSVAALLLFSVAILVYLRKKLLHNLISLSPVIVIVGLALFLGSDFIIQKVIDIFVFDNLISGQQTKKISAANILLGIEIFKTISLTDLFFGYGYFGLAENVPRLLYDSNLYPYFESTEMLQDPQSVGIVNLVLYFGLFQCFLMVLVLFKAKKYVNDVWLYKVVIFVVFLSLIKNSHTVDYLVHMFFVFGLSWASTHSLSKDIIDRYSKLIKNKY